MAWRVIARIGFTGDGNGSPLRNFIAGTLHEAGMRRSKTGTWESPKMLMDDAHDMLAEVLRACSHPTSVQGVTTSTLKHLWLYIDEVDAPDDGVDDDADPPSYAYGR